jgi:hypothetical protein
MSDFARPTHAAGSLDPPSRFPPTAVGAATPEPEPHPQSASGQWPKRSFLRRKCKLTDLVWRATRQLTRAATEAIRGHSHRLGRLHAA